MNHRHPDATITHFLSGAIFLLVVAYFVMQGWFYFTQPFRTITIYQYQDDESVQVGGWVVRDEQVLPHQDGGALQLTRQEGDRVSAGGTVARVFSDAASIQAGQDVVLATNLVEQLTFAQLATQSAEASLRLDDTIADTVLAYQQAIVSHRLEDADAVASDLRTYIRQRDFTYNAATVEEDLENAKAMRSTLLSQNRNASKTIRASQTGLYSAVVDGYEGILTPEALTTLTPGDLTALVPDTQTLSNVGKLILGDAWYYVVTVSSQVATKAAEDGHVGLRFTKGLSQTLDMEVFHVSETVGDSAVLVLKSREYLSELTLLRSQSAELIFDSIQGLRVPRTALRLNEEGETGIYCVVGMRAWFKPVHILYEGSDFMLVSSASTKASLQLRSGDQAIIAAKDLYDGMVVA